MNLVAIQCSNFNFQAGIIFPGWFSISEQWDSNFKVLFRLVVLMFVWLLILALSLNFIVMALSKRAVVVGASGATGREVVKELARQNWDVIATVRKPFDFGLDSKVTVVVSNLTNKEELIQIWKGTDVLFNCLGTTRGVAGSAEAFVHVEVGLTKLASDVAKLSGVRHVSVLSAQGANKNMWVPSTYIHPMLYTRTMGEKEQTVIDTGFESVTVFQPGMLNRMLGDRPGSAESLITWLLPSICLNVDTLAKAMVSDATKRLDALRNSATSGENCANTPTRVAYITGNGAITNTAHSV